MPYRELSMLEVREVLRRYVGGAGLRAIARGTGLDRKTVAKYLTAGTACGLHPGSAPPTDAQIATVLAQLQGPMGGRPGTTQAVLRPHQVQIQTWLTEGLRLTKIYRRLRAQGVAVSYSTLYRFAQTACGFGTPAVTVRVADPPPGEVAEVDFGVLGLWTDPATGTRRRVSGLLVTLCHSRYACLAVSLRQDLGALLDGLEVAWTFFGGVVHRLVLDNLTPAVTKADRYTPTLGKVFLEYAQYRGFVVDPTVPVHPTGKPKVERGIPYAREDFFRGETFRDLADMQTRALTWCGELAGTRLHGTTRQVPRVVFETVERALLLPLAPTPFDRPIWSQATVHPDHHVQFQRALYSVPTRYVGQRVDVRGDRRLVRIYAHQVLIKTHPRQAPGQRSTDYADYPAALAPYALRAPDRCIAQGAALGPAVGQFLTVLLGGVFPWARLRQAQALLRLAERFGAARVNAACARALAFDLVDVRRVQRILQAALEHEPAPETRGAVLALPARFARPPASFVHPISEEESHVDDRP
jgi:transposase